MPGPDAPIIGPADAEVVLDEGVGVARESGFDATGELVVAAGRPQRSSSRRPENTARR